jgi:hypothetical protein
MAAKASFTCRSNVLGDQFRDVIAPSDLRHQRLEATGCLAQSLGIRSADALRQLRGAHSPGCFHAHAVTASDVDGELATQVLALGQTLGDALFDQSGVADSRGIASAHRRDLAFDGRAQFAMPCGQLCEQVEQRRDSFVRERRTHA